MTASGCCHLVPSDDTEAISSLVVSTITTLTLGIAFALLALGVDFFWIMFPLGFGVVLPTALTVVGLHHATTPSETNVSPQSERARENLQQRYVRGELDDEEFEQKLEYLLEKEHAETTSISEK